MTFSLQHKKIWVAGHNGMVGAAVVRRLQDKSEQDNCDILAVSRSALDLRDQQKVHEWVTVNKPDAIILAAAHVGGLVANRDAPAEFLYNNLMIESNVIHAAYKAGVEKLLFLGSSCVYPKYAEQPIKEDALLSGVLEETNEAYAIAKIAGLKMCAAYREQYGCDFIAAMPCNLYGSGDRYDAQRSHVIPALIMKMHAAKIGNEKSVSLWGTGKPLREFMHVDNLADGLVFLLQNYSDMQHINIGSGKEISIKELAHMVADVVGYGGDILFDPSMPDGTPRKLMNNNKIKALGWQAQTTLKEGLAQTYQNYLTVGAMQNAA